MCLSLQVLPVSDISGVTGDDDGTSDDDDDDDVLYFLAEPDGACQVSDDDTVSYDFSDTPNDSDISDRPNGRDNQWTRNKLKCTKTDFDVPDVLRLNTVGVHLPEMLASHRRCRFCSSRKNNKRSRYQCKTCLVPLCISPCFAKFHGQ